VLTEDSVKRKKALLADGEYRKALRAQARSDLQQRYAGMRMELGLTEQEQNALFDLLVDAQQLEASMKSLLGRSGRALTNTQTRSLMAVMVAEQKRMEAEAQALRDAGQTDSRSPADIQAETNRRLLQQVPRFLDDQQVQVVRGRFEQRATIDRAADRVQQREREVLQESPNGTTVP
jgi:hypothetical protein